MPGPDVTVHLDGKRFLAELREIVDASNRVEDCESKADQALERAIKNEGLVKALTRKHEAADRAQTGALRTLAASVYDAKDMVRALEEATIKDRRRLTDFLVARKTEGVRAEPVNEQLATLRGTCSGLKQTVAQLEARIEQLERELDLRAAAQGDDKS